MKNFSWRGSYKRSSASEVYICIVGMKCIYTTEADCCMQPSPFGVKLDGQASTSNTRPDTKNLSIFLFLLFKQGLREILYFVNLRL